MDEELLHQPHDKFFKAAFSQNEVAKEHLAAFLPAAISEHLQLDKMKLDTTACCGVSRRGQMGANPISRPFCRARR